MFIHILNHAGESVFAKNCRPAWLPTDFRQQASGAA
jgi:hypothetical protein